MPPKRRIMRVARTRLGERVTTGRSSETVGTPASASAAAADSRSANNKRRSAAEPDADADNDSGYDDGEKSLPVLATPAGRRIAANDPRAIRMDDDMLEELRLCMAQVTVTDGETGERVQLDLSKPEDIAMMERTLPAIEPRTVNKEVVDARSKLALPEDPRTGTVRMLPGDLPDGVNDAKVFPLQQASFQEYMHTNNAMMNEFLVLLPLFPVPVWTSKLLCLMRLGHSVPATQNAYDVIRQYNAFMRILARNNRRYTTSGAVSQTSVVRSRTDAMLIWIEQRMDDRTLRDEDLDLVLKNCTTMADVPAEASFAEVRAHLAKDGLTKTHLRTAFAYVVQAARCAAGTVPWLREGQSCAEDITEDHVVWSTKLSDRLGDAIEELGDDADPTAVYTLVQKAVVDLLHLYEIAIMRLLSKEVCLDKETIPNALFGDLTTAVDDPDPGRDVHITVLDRVQHTRRLMLAAQDHFVHHTPETAAAVEAVRADVPDAESNVHARARNTDTYASGALEACRPTPAEIAQYVAFVKAIPEITRDDEKREASLLALGTVFRGETAAAAAATVAEVDAVVASSSSSSSSSSSQQTPAPEEMQHHIVFETPGTEEQALKAHLAELDAFAAARHAGDVALADDAEFTEKTTGYHPMAELEDDNRAPTALVAALNAIDGGDGDVVIDGKEEEN